MENESRQNNFDFLRFLAASIVIISHSFTLLKYDQVDFLGPLGVDIFFLISGYLITQSWLHSQDTGKFLTKRLLRIIPALAFCILVTIFLIGPLNTNLPIIQYFTNIHTWFYLGNILLYPLQFTLPGVFDKNISPFLVNHSLWTLPLEFTAYLFVAVFGIFRVLKKQFILIGVILLISASIFLPRFSFYTGVSFYDFGMTMILPYFIYFFIGALSYLCKMKIRFHPIFFSLAVIIVILGVFYPVGNFIDFFALTYMVFAIAFLPKKIYLFGKTDPSYGMYLFSMPIQQTFIHFFPGISPVSLLCISFPSTVLIACISWCFIESRALLLKKRI